MKTIANALLFLFVLVAAPLLAANTPERPSSPPAISGGAEARHLMTRAPIVPEDPAVDPLAPIYPGAGFDAFGFNDNATVNGGFLFIPPDPIGAAGVDRLIAVVNAGIEARTKTGTLLFRSSLQSFFSAAAGNLGSYCFDPKIIYDHHAGRFVVLALEQTDTGFGDPSDESRILLAVSRTGSPATATAADWYFQVINAKLTIGAGSTWADYPGLEVDEEAMYITVNQFPFSTSAGSFGSRLWIVDKGLVGGLYAGGPIAAAVHNAYVGGVVGFETTTMPCEILQAGGAGPGVGTFLLSYSGLTYGGLGNPEALIVIRVNNPLGAVTFTPEFVTIGNIEDIGGALGFPGLADAPQAGGAALIEVNDRRALDAVWRNGYIYLATTITPNAASDPVNAGQTTAHWVRLNATAVASSASPAGLIVLDQEGNIGGEDIAPGTYTFFPGLAVNSADQLQIGFAASAPSIYGGAYVAGRVPADPPGTVGPSGTVRAGVDYYYRAFGGARNRWGDYSGVAIDPADDGTFWIYNQWADVRGTPIGGEDGRWGTAWLECSFAPDAADLVVSEFAAPCCVYEGQQIGAQMFVEVTNYGPGASAACQLGLYVSADSMIDPGDTGLLNGVLAVPALAPGASAVLAVPANVTVPGGLAFGPQFLGALVDNGSAVAETDEANNTASTDAVVNADFYGCARGVASSVLTGDVSVFVVPDGSGDPLNRAQQFAGLGLDPVFIDATITTFLSDEQGNPLAGELLSLAGSQGNLYVCGAATLADGPTDAAGQTTFSGPLYGGGTSAVGEQLLIVGGSQQAIPGMVYGTPEMLGGSADGALYRVSLLTGLASPICGGFFNPDGSTEIEYDPQNGVGWSAAPEFYKQINGFDWQGCAVTEGPYVAGGYGFNGLEWIEGSLYGTGITNSCDPSFFVRMDPAAGSYVTIGATGAGPISGLAWDPVCRRLYGVTGCYNVYGTSDLVLIDMTTGTATVIGDTGAQLGSLEMGVDGRLYAGSASIEGRVLHVLDKTTGQATLIGPTNMSASVSGLTLVSDAGIPLRFNSADLTGDLVVNISDAGVFSAALYNGLYDYAIDFRYDGVENLSDASFMAAALGAACAGAAAAPVAIVDRAQAQFALEVDGADAQGLLSLAAGEAGTARLLVSGELARTGLRAWEGRIEGSDNLVIDAVELVDGSVDLGRDGDFVVAYGQPRRAESGAVEVATVRFHLTDDAAASLRFEPTTRSSVGGTAPALLAAGSLEPLAAGVVSYQDGAAAVINLAPRQELPPTLALDLHAVPNPFNPQTEIRFNLPRSGQLEVLVYDVRGRLVWSTDRTEMAAGAQALTWAGIDRHGMAATSGVYFYQLILDGQKLCSPGKMTLLK